MDERERFARESLAKQTPMAALCREYGISRKTGYKVHARFVAHGVAGLREHSRAPHHQALAVAEPVEAAVLQLRGQHPAWGARKLKAWLEQQRPGPRWPAASTIGSLLHRHGLTVPRRRRVRTPAAPPLAAAAGPNEVWSADFKGWFPTGDGARCLPFTLTDHTTRYLLRCQAVATGDGPTVQPLLEAAFREYGLPRTLRTDNGPPFASLAAGGLSRLTAWCVKLGIRPERIAPGHPEQNGRHERMHLTLQRETAQPPAATVRAQQRRFDAFRHVFNTERPHEALGQRPPASVYTYSPRPYPARLPALTYPADHLVRRVRHNGEIRWERGFVYISAALTDELIGLDEVLEDCWRVRFGPIVLGWIDGRLAHRERGPRRAPLRSPKLSPMCPV